MCGIAGFYRPQHQSAPQSDLALVRAMCDQIIHRGPDEDGYRAESGCAIGMRRLSIIDLSTGQQPISNEDGTIWVVFNGEIYNYQELREDLLAKGHTFRTRSDTEVLVHLYEQYGPPGIARLRGMFVYAIWDSRKRQLLLARDRFGKKPLYYSAQPDGLYFGSELKCLKVTGIPFDLDHDALKLYFYFTYVPDPRSIFRQVHKVDPGGWLLYSADGKVETGRYWQLPPPTDAPSVPNEARLYEEIREVFDESVRLRMIADVPLGAFLSGGVDSSSVVASMALHSKQPVKTFAIGFEESVYNELSYAQQIADKYKTEHHTLMVRPDSIALVEKLVHHFDEPFADSSAIPTYLVSEFAVQHVKVALSGDGGDEIFAGYNSFFLVNKLRRWDLLPKPARKLIAGSVRSLPSTAYGKNFLYGVSRPSALERYFEFNYFSSQILSSLLQAKYVIREGEDELRRLFPGCFLPADSDILLQALYFEATAKLTGDMLVKVDRMSMAASLEVRCPMLDHKLAELAARIPTSLKMKNGQGKACFITAMGDRLPRSVWDRPKHGFSVPLHDWFRGSLRNFLFDHLTGRQFRERELVHPAYVQQLLEEHDSRRRTHGSLLWRLLMIELWFRQWKDAPAAARMAS